MIGHALRMQPAHQADVAFALQNPHHPTRPRVSPTRCDLDYVQNVLVRPRRRGELARLAAWPRASCSGGTSQRRRSIGRPRTPRRRAAHARNGIQPPIVAQVLANPHRARPTSSTSPISRATPAPPQPKAWRRPDAKSHLDGEAIAYGDRRRWRDVCHDAGHRHRPQRRRQTSDHFTRPGLHFMPSSAFTNGLLVLSHHRHRSVGRSPTNQLGLDDHPATPPDEMPPIPRYRQPRRKGLAYP
jgi:hypothetical protein